MNTHPQVLELMSQVLSSGEAPEAVCRHCPELLEVVRLRLAEHQHIQSRIQTWFPPDARQSAPADRSPRAAPSGSPGVMPELPGYEIESLLGRGGMGLVYRARHLRLNRPVAIKVLVGGAQAGVLELERFFREAEAVASLQHPNIVQVYDIGEFGGQPYFTMELVEGGSLARKMAGVPQPARSAAAHLVTLAGAIHAAHQRGIIHRDLKPSNILLTPQGVPKISDFGLARRVESGASDLTLAGAAVGTPSYMSPEQAQGLMQAIGPATDVYSLGAILYEMLTGRPPFRGESPADTERQVINNPPVHPSRLNPKVPRSLETICLKCLEKDSKRRYEGALDLAEDLKRFLRGEPVAARRASGPERAWMWVCRRPAAAALYAALAVAVLLTGALVAGSVRADQQQAATVRAVQEDLQRLARFERTSQWADGKEVLARAQGRLATVAGDLPAGLREAVDRADANLELAQRLEFIRSHRAPLLGGTPDQSAASRDYEAAFFGAGLIVALDDQAGAAARVRESELTTALVAALDDWAVATQDERRRAWCLGVARLAAGDAAGWRRKLRDPEVWSDRAALAKVLGEAPMDDLSLSLLVAAAERLQDIGGNEEAVTFLKRVDRQRPGDLGVNLRLGFALIQQHKPGEAVGYYRAAVALEPDAVIHNNLGLALKAAGQVDEAISCYEQAIRLDPNYAPAHMNLGVALKATGNLEGAIACYRRAIEINPAFDEPHNNLANALRARGDLAGSTEHYELAARLGPTKAQPRYNLGLLLAGQGRDDEAIAQYEEALRLEPNLYQAHNNVGKMLAEREQWDRALVHLRRAVEIAPDDALSRTNLGKALQAQGEHPEEALHHLRQATRLRPDAGGLHASLGEALLAQGKLSDAEVSLRRALELLPEADSRRTEVQQNLSKCRDRPAALERGGEPPDR